MIKLSWKCRRHVGRLSSPHSVLTCFGQQPTCRRRHDWESILVTCRIISRHNICKASAKLARWDRCLLMSSWASCDIAHVIDMSPHMLPACRHVGMLAADMSDGGSSWHDMTPTFPTKSTCYTYQIVPNRCQQATQWYNDNVPKQLVMWGIKTLFRCPKGSHK
jgi:hypothetical protein